MYDSGSIQNATDSTLPHQQQASPSGPQSSRSGDDIISRSLEDSFEELRRQLEEIPTTFSPQQAWYLLPELHSQGSLRSTFSAGLVNRPERTTHDQIKGNQGSFRPFKLLDFFFKPADTQVSEHHDPSIESHTANSQGVWPLVGFAGFFVLSSVFTVEWRTIWYCNPERRAHERSNSNWSPFSSRVCLQPISAKFSDLSYSISNGEYAPDAPDMLLFSQSPTANFLVSHCIFKIYKSVGQLGQATYSRNVLCDVTRIPVRGSRAGEVAHRSAHLASSSFCR